MGRNSTQHFHFPLLIFLRIFFLCSCFEQSVIYLWQELSIFISDYKLTDQNNLGFHWCFFFVSNNFWYQNHVAKNQDISRSKKPHPIVQQATWSKHMLAFISDTQMSKIIFFTHDRNDETSKLRKHHPADYLLTNKEKQDKNLCNTCFDVSPLQQNCLSRCEWTFFCWLCLFLRWTNIFNSKKGIFFRELDEIVIVDWSLSTVLLLDTTALALR